MGGAAGRTFFVAAMLGTSLASAQTIRGSVVDGANGAAVPGVVVLLIDAAGTVVAKALTNESGGYRLSAGNSGSYRVRTLRIGFRPVVSDAIALLPDEDVTRHIVVTGVPFSLDTVRVERRSSTCRLRTDSAFVTYAIWEQVRTALTATDLSTRARNLTATIVTYERMVDAASNRIRRQTSATETGATSRPWTSLSPDSLRRVGYVATVDGWFVFTAPDITALLSTQFLEDHCFRIAESSDAARLGLDFQPIRERSNIPEIRGTLWLDRKSSELKRMEFFYTNVMRAQERGRAGGEMDFVRMKNGAWAISSWNIRMPVLEESLFKPGNAGDRAPMSENVIRMTQLKVAGGELALVMRGLDTIWTRDVDVPTILEAPAVGATASETAVQGAVFTGTVLSEAKQAPISGVDVSLTDAGLSGRTDAKGVFRIVKIPAGTHEVSLRQIGYSPLVLKIDFSDNVITDRQFVLTAAQVLDSVVVAGRRATIPEFEERRKLGIGRFLTRDELAEQESRRMSDVLAHIGGLRIERGTGGGQAWISGGRGQMTVYDPDPLAKAMGAKPACYVDVWLDGIRLYTGQAGSMGQPLFNVNSMQPGDLEAIEYFAGAASVPPKYFRSGLDCGVLVLWTRRG